MRVAAAVGVGPDALERAEALVDAGADALVLDTAHGHSLSVVEMARRLKSALDVELVAGNVATAEAAEALIDVGVDAVKVGRRARVDLHDTRRRGRRRAADHRDLRLRAGVRAARRAADRRRRDDVLGDVAKAIAAGADAVMLGSFFAGTEESPGDVVIGQGERYKEYRGMGSIGAMKARGYSKDRYFQGDVEDVEKLVPEGIEGRVPYKGPMRNVLYQLVGGLRQAMGYCGAATIDGAEGREVRAHHRRGPARVAPARRDDHEGGAELSALKSSGCRCPSRLRRSARCWCSTSAASTRS